VKQDLREINQGFLWIIIQQIKLLSIRATQIPIVSFIILGIFQPLWRIDEKTNTVFQIIVTCFSFDNFKG